jgi:hypothetical protein
MSQPPAHSNGLGVAGFICSLVGVIGCWGFFPVYLLTPIGFILSLIAVFKPPRGFAIAGLVIGAVGSCGVVPALLLLPALFIGLGVGGLLAGLFGFLGPEIETQFELGIIEARIGAYEQENGAPPPGLASLNLDADLQTDGWGNAYRYQLRPDGTYTLSSMGPDGVPDTADDLTQ